MKVASGKQVEQRGQGKQRIKINADQRDALCLEVKWPSARYISRM